VEPAPRGVPQIEVAFDIDANGIVNVSARDLVSGKGQSMVITGGSALPRWVIDRMVRDAARYVEQDRRHRKEAEVRDRADSLAYSTEKFLRENSDKLSADLMAEARDAVAEVKINLQAGDTDAIRTSAERLDQVSRKISTAIGTR
jgi:molecular chaperone DnaK